jgi:hypothetical protein
MQNDPSAPSAPPSRGFGSIITLVSDVSPDIEALEKAAIQPVAAVAAPAQPVRIGPSNARDNAPPLFSSADSASESSSGETPWWVYAIIGFVILRILAKLMS